MYIIDRDRWREHYWDLNRGTSIRKLNQYWTSDKEDRFHSGVKAIIESNNKLDDTTNKLTILQL